jgi:hypothetical protein
MLARAARALEAADDAAAAWHAARPFFTELGPIAVAVGATSRRGERIAHRMDYPPVLERESAKLAPWFHNPIRDHLLASSTLLVRDLSAQDTPIVRAVWRCGATVTIGLSRFSSCGDDMPACSALHTGPPPTDGHRIHEGSHFILIKSALGSHDIPRENAETDA